MIPLFSLAPISPSTRFPTPRRSEFVSADEDIQQVVLDGVALDAVTEAECVARVQNAWSQGLGGFLHTPNLDHLRMLQRDTFFKSSTRNTDLSVADGMPLIWASKLQGTPLPERVCGSDLIRSLTKAAASDQKSVFFLGGNPGTAEAAAQQLQREFPGFRIAGTFCPAFGFEAVPAEMLRIRQKVVESNADLIFVALGCPKSEHLIHSWRKHLPKSWWIGVGISFSFVIGEVQRAPVLVQRMGMEWAHRMVQEPRRLMKRYLIHGLPYAAGLFTRALWARFFRRGQRTSYRRILAPPIEIEPTQPQRAADWNPSKASI